MRTIRRPLPVALLLAAIAATALWVRAQEAPPEPTGSFSESIEVVAVDVVVSVFDATGATPHDLTAADFRVVVDGREWPVVSAVLSAPPAAATPAAVPAAAEPTAVPAPDPAAAAPPADPAAAPPPAVAPAPDEPLEWRTVIYFDQPLLALPAVERAAGRLADQAAALTRLGPVEVVFAGPLPNVVLPATRDAAKLADALREVGRRAHGGQELLAIRRRYQAELGDTTMSDVLMKANVDRRQRGTPGDPRGGDATILDRTAERREDPYRDTSRKLARQRMMVRHYARAEAEIVNRQRTVLLDWVAGYGGGKPRALLLVSDGYDEDPRDYYLSGIDSERMQSELQTELSQVSTGPDSEQLDRLLAGQGWTVVSLALGGLAHADLADASIAGRERYRSFVGSKYSTAGGRGYSSASGQDSLFVAPLAPLIDLAEATGGDLVVDEREIGAAVAGLGERYVVTYQVSGRPEGKLSTVEVTAKRPGLTVVAPDFVAAATPEGVAALRARRLLEGSPRGGDLPLAIAAEVGAPAGDNAPAHVQAVIDLGPLQSVRGGLAATSLRATVAVLLPNGQAFIHHQTASGQDLRQLAEWRYDANLTLPVGSSTVAVVVEELSTGAWGGAAAAFAAPSP